MKIVLTGGPSAGKTSIIDILYRSDWYEMAVVQEAASVLFRGGFPRSKDHIHVRCQQRAIYHVQRELEEIGAIEAFHRALICDRGSLDGLAYWPDDEASFFKSVSSSMEKEIVRYDWVIHLDTASAADYQSSEIRREGSDEAVVMNQKVKHAWRLHPNRLIIPNNSDFLQKVDIALKVVKMILEHRTVEMIRKELSD